jgi:hypothetical protein
VLSEYPRAATFAGLDGSQPFLMNPFGDCLFDKRENELKEICIPLIEFYPMPYQIVNFERIVERDEELAMVIA